MEYLTTDKSRRKIFYTNNYKKLFSNRKNSYPFRQNRELKCLAKDKPWIKKKYFKALSLNTRIPVEVIKQLHNTLIELIYEELRNGREFKIGNLGILRVVMVQGANYDFRNKVYKGKICKERIVLDFYNSIKEELTIVEENND